MANLPTETIDTVFYLQRRLWELIDDVTKTAWAILEGYGETETSISELEQLENATERMRNSYSRLYNLMLQIAQSQPSANSATLNLLAESIEAARAIRPLA